ncbi:hypothetical protein AB2N08_15595 [Massilia aurea]|uniref:hypothetical protein n=1 Tax=Massilia aurea TaxID=373040 RepID=UPI0034620812
MDRIRAIERLTARLHGASVAADWDALGRAAGELAPGLTALAARGAWTAPERTALARLRAAHDGAAQACARAIGDVRTRLDEMSNNKEGWMAYALTGEPEPGEVMR